MSIYPVQVDFFGKTFEPEVVEDDSRKIFPNFLLEDESLGTTIIGMKYRDGVIVGADSFTSMGRFISDRYRKKIFILSNNIVVLSAGSSADNLYLADVVKYHLALHEMETGERPDVRVAANLFQQIIYRNKGFFKSSNIVGGWDKRKGAQVYIILGDGVLFEESISYSGSGSTYLYGFLDSGYKPDMTKEEARKLFIDAVSHACRRDAASGGPVSLAFVDENGIEEDVVGYENLPTFNQG